MGIKKALLMTKNIYYSHYLPFDDDLLAAWHKALVLWIFMQSARVTIYLDGRLTYWCQKTLLSDEGIERRKKKWIHLDSDRFLHIIFSPVVDGYPFLCGSQFLKSFEKGKNIWQNFYRIEKDNMNEEW